MHHFWLCPRSGSMARAFLIHSRILYDSICIYFSLNWSQDGLLHLTATTASHLHQHYRDMITYVPLPTSTSIASPNRYNHSTATPDFKQKNVQILRSLFIFICIIWLAWLGCWGWRLWALVGSYLSKGTSKTQ